MFQFSFVPDEDGRLRNHSQYERGVGVGKGEASSMGSSCSSLQESLVQVSLLKGCF